MVSGDNICKHIKSRSVVVNCVQNSQVCYLFSCWNLTHLALTQTCVKCRGWVTECPPSLPHPTSTGLRIYSVHTFAPDLGKWSYVVALQCIVQCWTAFWYLFSMLWLPLQVVFERETTCAKNCCAFLMSTQTLVTHGDYAFLHHLCQWLTYWTFTGHKA